MGSLEAADSKLWCKECGALRNAAFLDHPYRLRENRCFLHLGCGFGQMHSIKNEDGVHVSGGEWDEQP